MDLTKGILAVTDQGVVSLGNFLTSIFLARTLSPAEYGQFAVLFGIMVLLNSIHAAFLLYPLALDAAVAGKSSLGKLLGSRLQLTVGLFFIELPLLLFSFAPGPLKPTQVLEVGAALLFWQMQETCRRGLLAQFRFSSAIVGDTIAYGGQVATLFLLWHFQHLSFPTAFVAIALTSLASLVFQSGWIRVGLATFEEVRRILLHSLKLGTWPAASFVIMTAQTVPLYTWLLGRLTRPENSAGFQALGNIVGITHPVVFSMATVIIPLAARVRVAGTAQKAWLSSLRTGLRFVTILVSIYLVAFLLPQGTLTLFYGRNSAYVSLTTALRVLCLAYSANCFVQIGYAFLLAMERPKIDLYANLVAAAVASAIFCAGLHRDVILTSAYAIMSAISIRAVILIICSIRLSRGGSAGEVLGT